MIKSPLRYPGGKTRAIKTIAPIIPPYREYREPFVGGGSVFAYVKQVFFEESYWINDLNYDLFLFWKFAKNYNRELVDQIKRVKNKNPDGRSLFEHYKKNLEQFSNIERATRFFILNRITFSGTTDSGGYSKEAFEKRFTDSSIKRLADIEELLRDTKITNFDYEKVVMTSGKNVFIFLDPPYYSTRNSRLYGKNGVLHTGFDHERFADVMKKCSHKWLITYDDCKETRRLFSFANITPWSLQYGMNNYKQDSAKKGKEIFISNYRIK